MEADSTIQLKRPNEHRDGPPAKRRNTGNIFDGRRIRSTTDPLNLNNASQESSSGHQNDSRKRRFEDAAGSIHQRRMSFRQSKKRHENAVQEPTSSCVARKEKQIKMNRRYRYGNFNYTYKGNFPFQNDPRIDLLVEDWFKGKNVLDIGCNAGLLTLSIARTFSPRRILGIDIDPYLIGVARKNIRHFQDKDQKIIGRYPASFALNYGPISVPSTITTETFPGNVWFCQDNYILPSDEDLENVKQEFDVIVAFSLTKWIHLNWGDAGLMRFFKRVYRQLTPGGRFIFEPQRDYRSRSKMVPEMEENYKLIKLWPDNFVKYLISSVGFVHFEALDTPLVRLLDCDAPILMFYKGPMIGWEDSLVESESATQESFVPFNDMTYTCTPRADGSQCDSTPKDDPQSAKTTPARND